MEEIVKQYDPEILESLFREIDVQMGKRFAIVKSPEGLKTLFDSDKEFKDRVGLVIKKTLEPFIDENLDEFHRRVMRLNIYENLCMEFGIEIK